MNQCTYICYATSPIISSNSVLFIYSSWVTSVAFPAQIKVRSVTTYSDEMSTSLSNYLLRIWVLLYDQNIQHDTSYLPRGNESRRCLLPRHRPFDVPSPIGHTWVHFEKCDYDMISDLISHNYIHVCRIRLQQVTYLSLSVPTTTVNYLRKEFGPNRVSESVISINGCFLISVIVKVKHEGWKDISKLYHWIDLHTLYFVTHCRFCLIHLHR